MGKHNRLGALIIVSGILITVVSTFLFVILPMISKPPTTLWLGDGVFRTQLALTDNSRTKGLSGQKELAADEALLMVFPNEAKWGIWMKDMNFPIDIIWLNNEKKVVDIVKNAPPEDSINVTSFEPKYPAKYVVELPAGTVDRKAISINRVAIFQINDEDIK